MRVLTALCWASAAAQAYSTSPQAAVYINSDVPSEDGGKPPSISPSDARLLFAQRLGLSQYHSLGDIGQDSFKFLNTYGEWQENLFSEERWHNPRRLLVIVEGVQHPQDLLGDNIRSPAFTIHEPPSSSDNLRLISDLVLQDKHCRAEKRARESGSRSETCYYELSKSSSLGGGVLGGRSVHESCGLEQIEIQPLEGNEQRRFSASLTQLVKSFGVETSGQTAIFHIRTLENLAPKHGAAYIEAVDDVKSTLTQLLSEFRNQSHTLVLMPPSSKTSKRASNSYGTYIKPSQLARRAQPLTEEPLAAISPDHTSTSSSPPASKSKPQTLAASSAPVTAILPVCHSTLEAAIDATHNCSGHGTPYRKYSDERGGKTIDCFACRCTSTVTKDSEGKTKTVHWGGPACQKKDISASFWLLAGLGILLAATVSWGIGLLFSIGEEELPSVIGAGVAGPRAQK